MRLDLRLSDPCMMAISAASQQYHTDAVLTVGMSGTDLSDLLLSPSKFHVVVLICLAECGAYQIWRGLFDASHSSLIAHLALVVASVTTLLALKVEVMTPRLV